MIFLSTVLACLLIGSGLSAVFIGSGMIVLERGWSMVISGSVVATGGVLLLGIAMLIRELRRLPERLVDMLPDALPHAPYATADFTEDIGEPDEDETPRRPRIGADMPLPPAPGPVEPYPEPVLPQPVAVAPPAAHPSPPEVAVHTPAPSFLTEESAARDKDAPATSSGLKIQISLHGSPARDAPRSGEADRALSGQAESSDRPELTEAGESPGDDRSGPAGARARGNGKPGRSTFWSRLGRSESPAAEPEPPPPEPETPQEPAGPTAAERARERLALADTPETALDDAAAERRTDEATPPAAGDGTPAAGIAGPRPDETRDDAPVETPRPAADVGGTVPPRTGEDGPAIVGSYRAAGNLYVMFDDGSIEVEMPHGIFRFPTLDKLKAYIASGEDPALAGPRVDRPATEDSAALNAGKT